MHSGTSWGRPAVLAVPSIAANLSRQSTLLVEGHLTVLALVQVVAATAPLVAVMAPGLRHPRAAATVWVRVDPLIVVVASGAVARRLLRRPRACDSRTCAAA
jgi:hypothetical protein